MHGIHRSKLESSFFLFFTRFSWTSNKRKAHFEQVFHPQSYQKLALIFVRKSMSTLFLRLWYYFLTNSKLSGNLAAVSQSLSWQLHWCSLKNLADHHQSKELGNYFSSSIITFLSNIFCDIQKKVCHNILMWWRW